jgi:uncharacterized protein with HEPN domain
MSNKRTDKDYLGDIQEALERIQTYVEGYTFERFVKDSKTQDAVLRNLEILGEAAKRVSDPMRKHRENIPWKTLAGLRDRLIHHYFGINYETVWQIITVELPKIASDIKHALEDR